MREGGVDIETRGTAIFQWGVRGVVELFRNPIVSSIYFHPKVIRCYSIILQ